MIRLFAIALTVPLSIPLAALPLTVPVQAETDTMTCAATAATPWGDCYRKLWQGLADAAVSVYRSGLLAQSSDSSAASADGKISFDPLEQGNYSSFHESFEQMITQESDWQEFWEQLHGTMSPSPDIPEIDFENYSVIAVGLGDRPDGSYSVEVDQVRLDDNSLIVHYNERRSCGMATMAITQPYQVVRIERTTAPVSFRRHQASPDC